ncbi:MAG: hypothetical protein N3B17_08445 [Chlorobi bacterium]|nr:hypothetical protein [Chlorobiota bacterium]
MKTAAILASVCLATLVAIAAEVSVEYLTARSDGRSITVEWKPTVERDIARYDIERSTDNRTWTLIASLDPKGSGTVYRYVDNDVLGKGSGDPSASARVYYYRLRIVGTDNSTTYTSSTAVTHNLSTVRRTWGMIKEMFK